MMQVVKVTALAMTALVLMATAYVGLFYLMTEWGPHSYTVMGMVRVTEPARIVRSDFERACFVPICWLEGRCSWGTYRVVVHDQRRATEGAL